MQAHPATVNRSMVLLMKFREEKDTMGTVRIPENAYYGPQTQRAVENFPISGLRLPPAFMRALALIKKCAARVNRDLDLLGPKLAEAIETGGGRAKWN